MAIKGAIFDMDGTLLDSMHVWIGISERYLVTKGIVITPEIQKEISGMMLKEMAEYFIEKFKLLLNPEDIIREINGLVEEEYFHKVKPKPGIPELLEDMQSRGIKMCVATATDRYMAEAALKRCDLLKYFGHLFTCGEEGANKTTSQIYDTALKFLGTPKEETYIFEDTLIPVKTAKDANYNLVAIADKWSAMKAPQIKDIADYYVENPLELNIDLL